MTTYAFYSNHSDKTKSGILIGIYLRALRICSVKFINKEFEHTRNSFSKLLYPESLIHRAKSKSIHIHKHTSNNIDKNKARSNTNPIQRHMILLQNPAIKLIGKD